MAMRRNTCCATSGLLAIALVMSGPAWADNAADKAELAKKTLNPVADLISLPIQFHLPAAVFGLHHENVHLFHDQYRVDVRLGGR
jgi:hypothetical protein